MGYPVQIKRYTPAEYYELERAADYKSEYYKGEIFAMSGGTARHSLISLNLGRELSIQLKCKPCTAYESNLRLRVRATQLITYPDASVYCEELEFDEDDSGIETATNPTAIFEVLSKTSEKFDRGAKFDNYEKIPTLQAYALVSQRLPKIWLYQRPVGGNWERTVYEGLDASVKIDSIGVNLQLGEVYEKVKFAESPSPRDEED